MKEKDNSKSFDILGNIAIVKFSNSTNLKDKKKFANKILRDNPSIKTILEKTRGFKGRLRKQETKHIAGIKTKEVLYKENGCVFRFNADSTYFSPRLSNERKEISGKIKRKDNVLVMFSGVAPFGIIIAKKTGANVTCVEINREANKYAKLNVELNKLLDKVQIVQGDIKKIADLLSHRPSSSHSPYKFSNFVNVNGIWKVVNFKGKSVKDLSVNKYRAKRATFPNKFDVIVMPRPRLKDIFLKQVFMLSKKGTRIFYYDFTKADEMDSIVEKIKTEAKKSKKKIKILDMKFAGEVAPYTFRVRIDLKAL